MVGRENLPPRGAESALLVVQMEHETLGASMRHRCPGCGEPLAQCKCVRFERGDVVAMKDGHVQIVKDGHGGDPEKGIHPDNRRPR